LVKTYVLDQFLVEWFTKYLLAPIKGEVAKGGVMIEEKVIAHAQYLDLVYTQSDTLYDKIPNAPRSLNIFPPLMPGKESHAANGIICPTSMHTTSKPYGIAPPAYAENPHSHPLTTSASEINVVSSDKGKSQQQPGSKKKGKGKKNKYPSRQDK